MSRQRSTDRRRSGRGPTRRGGTRDDPRALAAAVLSRIDDGAYANLVLARELQRSDLDGRDRALVTALVDGTTRMRRACDHLVDRFVRTELEPEVRRILRMGAYQLVFMNVPAHAAVSATVEIAPRRVTGLVNAVLRRVAGDPLDPSDPKAWPDEATRLSFPDWILERLRADLGDADAFAALAAMNEPAAAVVRADGYVQDTASSAVVDAVRARPGERIVDVCAAPGGKTTALAGSGAQVIAFDRTANRVGLITANAQRTDTAANVHVGVADGRSLPVAAASADAVLVDAPCSGLGTLRRRADARWRIDEAAVDRLSILQCDLLHDAARLVRRDGRLIYSVCTLTAAETTHVANWFVAHHPKFTPVDPGDPWSPLGYGGRLLPTPQGRDGMTVFCYRRR